MPDFTNALATAAGRSSVKHITVLLTWPAYLLPLMNAHRNACLGTIRAAGPRKLRVAFRTPEQGKHTYIHSKLVIVDDEFATIGSANINNRGFSFDTEITAGIHDQHTPGDVVLNMAHRLRIKLWVEHLGLPAEELVDGVASAVHWLDPPSSAAVTLFNENDPVQPTDQSVVDTFVKYLDEQQAATSPLPPGPGMTWSDIPNLIQSLDENGTLEEELWDTIVDPDGR